MHILILLFDYIPPLIDKFIDNNRVPQALSWLSYESDLSPD